MEIKWHLLIFGVILTVSGVSAGKCIVCDSTNDKCKAEPSTITPTDCSTDCFTLVENDGKIKRGCVADTGEKCTGKNCKKCPAAETACNIQTNLFTCKACKSSENADCAYWKNPESIQNEICNDGITKCRKEITDDKHTTRRCEIKEDKECSGSKCSSCTESGCNTGIFPDNRRKCYQCKSCATPTADSACLLYEESDACYEYGSSEATMNRGCKSDTTDYQKCTSESPKEKCKECTTDNCNNDAYTVSSTVKCFQCKSDDAKCVETQTGQATDCTSKIEYWKPHKCYINRVDGGKVSRGCLQDFDCAGNAATCSSCDSSGCNSAEKTTSCCLKCRSDIYKECADEWKENTYKSEPCRNPMTIAADSKQCYVENWNGIIIRSCLADADPKTRKHCLDPNQKTCKTCNGDDCNKEKAPDSAVSFALSSGLLVASLLVLKFF